MCFTSQLLQFKDNPAIKSERRFKSLVVMFVDWIASPATIKLQVDLRSPIKWSMVSRTVVLDHRCHFQQPWKDRGRLNKFLALFSRSSYFETTF